MTKFQSTPHQVIFNLRAKSGNQKIGHVCAGVLNEENPAHSVSRLGCRNQKKTGSGLDHNLKRLDCGCSPCYFWQHQLSVITNQILKNWLGLVETGCNCVLKSLGTRTGAFSILYDYVLTLYLQVCMSHSVMLVTFRDILLSWR